jgi:hypothetical protein
MATALHPNNQPMMCAHFQDQRNCTCGKYPPVPRATLLDDLRARIPHIRIHTKIQIGNQVIFEAFARIEVLRKMFGFTDEMFHKMFRQNEDRMTIMILAANSSKPTKPGAAPNAAPNLEEVLDNETGERLGTGNAPIMFIKPLITNLRNIDFLNETAMLEAVNHCSFWYIKPAKQLPPLSKPLRLPSLFFFQVFEFLNSLSDEELRSSNVNYDETSMIWRLVNLELIRHTYSSEEIVIWNVIFQEMNFQQGMLLIAFAILMKIENLARKFEAINKRLEEELITKRFAKKLKRREIAKHIRSTGLAINLRMINENRMINYYEPTNLIFVWSTLFRTNFQNDPCFAELEKVHERFLRLEPTEEELQLYDATLELHNNK